MAVLGAVGNVETFSCYIWIDLVNPSLLFRRFDLFFVFLENYLSTRESVEPKNLLRGVQYRNV